MAPRAHLVKICGIDGRASGAIAPGAIIGAAITLIERKVLVGGAKGETAQMYLVPERRHTRQSALMRTECATHLR